MTIAYDAATGAQLWISRVDVPFRRRRDMPGFEDPADRGGTDPVAEPEQLAQDALGRRITPIFLASFVVPSLALKLTRA